MRGSARWASNPADDEQPRGLEALGQGADDVVDAGPVDVARGARGKREVDGGAQARPGADLPQPARARVQRVLVERHVGHARVGPEDVLRAVAVVGVVVDDEHPLSPVGQDRCGDGHVVEEAEPHGAARRGVMPRGTDRAERAVGVARTEPVDGGEPGTDGQEGRLVGRVARGGVAVEPPTPSRGGALDEVDQRRRVDELHLRSGGGAGCNGEQGIVEPGQAHTVEDRLQAGGPLRVASTGIVVEVPLVGEEEDGHARRSVVPRLWVPPGAGRRRGPGRRHYRGSWDERGIETSQGGAVSCASAAGAETPPRRT